MTELGPCPFCGSRRVRESRDPMTKETCIACESCDLSIKTWMFESTREDLIRKWNRRSKSGERYICKECDPPCILNVGDLTGSERALAIPPATCPYKDTDTEAHTPKWTRE